MLSAGSLRKIMDEVMTLEEAAIDQAQADVGAFAISHERWQPLRMPELPACFNWLGLSPVTKTTTHRVDKTYDIRCRLGLPQIEEGGVREQTGDVTERYHDAFADVLEPALLGSAPGGPLGGEAREAALASAQMVLVTFNEVDVLCLEFSLQARVHRPV